MGNDNGKYERSLKFTSCYLLLSSILLLFAISITSKFDNKNK